MRFGVTGFVVALLMTGGINAGEFSVRRVVSHDPPSDLEARLLTLAAESGARLSVPEQNPNQRGSGAAIVEMLPNGDFESGASVWTEASLNGWNLILESSEFPLGVTPRRGNWGVWLGGDLDEIGYVQQQVTIPLRLWMRTIFAGRPIRQAGLSTASTCPLMLGKP